MCSVTEMLSENYKTTNKMNSNCQPSLIVGRWLGLGAPNGCKQHGASGLVSKNDLVGTGRAISVLFGVNGARNK